jgi:hypothetical protein
VTGLQQRIEMGPITVLRERARVVPLRSGHSLNSSEVAERASAALTDGDALVCIVSGPRRRQIEQELRSNGIDVFGALIREQLVCLNALDTFTRIVIDDAPDIVRFAEVVGATVDRAANRYGRVLIFGELDLLPRSSGNAAGKLHELLASFVECRPAFFSLELAGARVRANESHPVRHMQGGVARVMTR